MEFDTVLQMLFYVLPAIVVGMVTMYFLKTWQNEQNKQRYFEMRKQTQKQALPIKLQAYERMALFLERISLHNLIPRIQPFDDSAENYKDLLLKTIEQEFEHNLAQQIYFSEDTWSIIKASKHATMAIIRKAILSNADISSYNLRELLLKDLNESKQPTKTALSQLRDDVKHFI